MGRAEAETTLREYGGISHQVIIVQKHKDFVIDVGQVIYQHRTIVCAWTRGGLQH
jgi:hypothetical protein